MVNVSVNIVVNWAGRFANLFLNLIFLPIYLLLLGEEGYGLVGFFGALQATMVILELGLGAAVTRELARLAAVAGSAREQRDVVATTAAVFWGVGVAVFLAVLAFSGHASRDWFHAAELDAGTVRTALILMGVLLCLQMPGSLYFSALMGLHRQIHANAVVVAVAVVRNVGAWLVLLAVRDLSGVIAFFAWHALMHVVQAGILKFLVARHLPPAAERGRFRRATLRHLWRFSSIIAIFSVTNLLMWNLDRFLVAKLFPLDVLGHYSVAASLAMGVLSVAIAFAAAVFPHLSHAVQEDGVESPEVERYFLRLADALVLFMLPLGITIAALASPVLAVWTGDARVAARAGGVASILAVAATFRGIFNLSVVLLAAWGRPRMVVAHYVASLALFVPVTVALALAFGTRGAALGVLGYAVFLWFPAFFKPHARIVPSARRAWLGNAFLPRLAACVAIAVAARHFHDPEWTRLAQLGWIAATLAACFAATLVLSPRLLALGMERLKAEDHRL